MLNIKKIEIDFLNECAEDYVGLWSLIKLAKNYFHTILDLKLKRIILDLIYRNLIDEQIEAGEIPKDKEFQFLKWDMSPEDIIKRIEKEWDKLEKEPDLGDVVWFTLRNPIDSSKE
jgi:hypothetical protein